MKIALFYHSIYSDWNHGNAHFLRGIVRELMKKGHEVLVFEPEDSWSRVNMIRDHGLEALRNVKKRFPGLPVKYYTKESIDLERELDSFDAAIVHEWNEPWLIEAVGAAKRHCGFMLFFHDTHHRAVSDPLSLHTFNFSEYDGVLAFGRIIAGIYLQKGWIGNAWVWHEAADTSVFYPRKNAKKAGDLVWVGNWGDGERTEELREFLIEPAKELRLKAKVYGVRYPDSAIRELEKAGIEYGGWAPNYLVPEVFSRHRATVHIPRKPYMQALPGIPTIRPFEALACGIPLVCSPWRDAEGLFNPGRDYLAAADKKEMKECLSAILSDSRLSDQLAENGLKTIREKHTCAHRVEQLEEIFKNVLDERVLSK